MLGLDANLLYPNRMILFEDISIERAPGQMNLTHSDLCFNQSYTGDIGGTIRMACDLNFSKLKKSQRAFVEGVICEAFNMLSQEIFLNLCEIKNIAIHKLPTVIQRRLQDRMECHQLYRLNLPMGFCHFVIEINAGGLD